MAAKPNSILALDLGEKRIGLARASMAARLPEPLPLLGNDENFVARLKALIEEYSVDTLVIGLPRNGSGQETAQSSWARQFAESVLRPNFSGDIVFQDETLSSVAAESYDSSLIAKFGLDSLAALEIMKDYLENKNVTD